MDKHRGLVMSGYNSTPATLRVSPIESYGTYLQVDKHWGLVLSACNPLHFLRVIPIEN